MPGQSKSVKSKRIFIDQMVLRDSNNEFGSNYVVPPSKDAQTNDGYSMFGTGALSAMDRLAFGSASAAEVDSAAKRMGLDDENTDLYTGDGDTDTDLSDMESVASFSSEASDLDEDHKKFKNKKKAIKKSWFTITLGPSDELEEASDEDDDERAEEEEAMLVSGKGGHQWKTRLQAAGLGEAAIEALGDSGVDSLREIGFLNDGDFESLGFSLDDIACARGAVAEAAAEDANNRPVTDWRVYVAAANLKPYISVLEGRGIMNHHELSLITDEEYSKLTRTGMTQQEISQLREVLADAEDVPSGNKSRKKKEMPAKVQSQFSFLGAGSTFDVGVDFGLSTFDNAFGSSFDIAKRTFDQGSDSKDPSTESDAVNDVASQLRNLSPDQGAVLLEDMSLPAQAKLLSLLSPNQAAQLIQCMRTDSISKGGLLLKLPNRVRGLVVMELKVSSKVAVLEAVRSKDAYRLLLALDAANGDRFKTLSQLREEVASDLLCSITAVERSRLMDSMPLHEQTNVLAMLSEEERGESLRALPLEVQVALLEDMNDEDRATSLSFVDSSVLAMMLTDMPAQDREASLSHMSYQEISALLVSGMTALSKIEITAVERLDMEELVSRNNRLEDMISETKRAILKLKENSSDPSLKDRMWESIRKDAKAASSAQRELCLTLQNKTLGRTDVKDLNPPKDVVEQLTLAGRRSGAIRLLLHELPFIDASATIESDGVHHTGNGLASPGGGGIHHGGSFGSSLGSFNGIGGAHLQTASQEDLLKELGVRLGAGDDAMLAIERLALATGYTKKGTSIDIFSGSANSRSSTSAKDARFSLRCDGISPSSFDGEAQTAMEVALAKGYGLKDGVAKVNVVGMYVAGSLAGGIATGSAEGGSSVVVDLHVVNFKTAKACSKFVASARESNKVPLSKAEYGDVTFEKPPCVCSEEAGHITGVPNTPSIVAVSPGDGEAKILVVPPSVGSKLDSSVLEVEVMSNPGRLRGLAAVGEPIIVKGLANGTRYRFTAHVRNATGWSQFCAPSAPIIPGDLTAAPMPPEIAAVSAAEADFEVSVLVAPAGKYFLRPCTLVEIKSEPDGRSAFAPPDVPILMEGLRPGVEYRFRARAKNVNGWSKSSKPSLPISLPTFDIATKVSIPKAVFGEHVPAGFEEDNEEDLDEAAKQAMLDHNMEKDLLRKGKSPLEVLLHKQRFKRSSMSDALTTSDLSEQTGSPSVTSTELTPEELQILDKKRQAEKQGKSFSVKEEANMSADVFSLQMKDIPGLTPADNKFIRRFVGLMSTKGMNAYRHGARSRKKTNIRLDPAGMTLFWDADTSGNTTEVSSIDLTYEGKDVFRGQVFSWFRSISLDPDLCVSVVCKPTSNKKKPKRLDLELASKDDATLLYAALSVLNHARQPDVGINDEAD